jgi:hypothetical protein
LDGTDIKPGSYYQVGPSRSLRQRTVSTPGNFRDGCQHNSNFVRTDLCPRFSPVRSFNALLLDEVMFHTQESLAILPGPSQPQTMDGVATPAQKRNPSTDRAPCPRAGCQRDSKQQLWRIVPASLIQHLHAAHCHTDDEFQALISQPDLERWLSKNLFGIKSRWEA